jgi:hypothetical protein
MVVVLRLVDLRPISAWARQGNGCIKSRGAGPPLRKRAGLKKKRGSRWQPPRFVLELWGDVDRIVTVDHDGSSLDPFGRRHAPS